MAAATPTSPADARAALSPGRVAGLWARHLVSLYIPGVALAFLWTGPHARYVAPLFMLPLVLAHQLDCSARVERSQPREELPAWPFDALVYLLAALQVAAVAGTVWLFTRQGVFSVDMVMVFLVVGASSGFSIITAHELIHRKRPWEQALGRLLLCTVLYEHFYTEHLRGHHVRVGTPEDPATARFGEGYEPFFRRTVPAQLRSAWRLEKRRLGDADMPWWDRRMLRHRVLHGLVVEWGAALAILGLFGFASFFAFVLQAFVAVRLLEAVNYFEHWGLRRRGRRVRPADSWDTHSWFTYYGLIGLSRHADHHAWPARPYQHLRVWEEAPILPHGYVGTVDLVMGRNDEFQRAAAVELGRRRLGPFRPPEGEEAAGGPVPADEALARLEAEHARQRRPARARGLRRALGALPKPVRGALALGLVAAVTAAGVAWEAGEPASWGARALLHAWILGVFAVAIRLRSWLGERIPTEVASWALGFAVLVALGLATEAWVRPLLL